MKMINNILNSKRRSMRLFFNVPVPKWKNLKRHFRNAKKRLTKIDYLVLLTMLSIILFVVKFTPTLWFLGLLEFNFALMYLFLTVLGL